MVYIDYDFYCEYFGERERSEETDRLFARASEIIDIVTGFKICKAGFDQLDSFTKEQVRLAVAAETDYLEKNGGTFAMDSSAAVQMTLGRFSYMNGSGTSERSAFPVSPLALSYLEPTGLLYRGTGVM